MTVEPSTVKDAGNSPVDSSESVYRRCVPGWFSPNAKQPAIRDFMPRHWESDERPGDSDGLSVTRPAVSKASPEEASLCPMTGKRFHVAEVSVAFIQSHPMGLTVVPDGKPHDAGHAIIPQLNSVDRREPDKETWMEERAKKLRENAKMVFVLPPIPKSP